MEYEPRLACANCPQVITCAENIDTLHDERTTVIDRAFVMADIRVELEEAVTEATNDALIYGDSTNELVREESRFRLVIFTRALQGAKISTLGLTHVLDGYDRAIERSFDDVDSLTMACRGLNNCMKGDPRQAWSYRMKNTFQRLLGKEQQALANPSETSD